MAFKRLDSKMPKGRLVPMYISDNGDLYSLMYKDRRQFEYVSKMVALFLCGIMGSPLVVDDEPINDGLERFRLSDKSRDKKN